MSKGRRIGRIPFLPPSSEVREKYLLHWEAGPLYNSPQQFPALTGENLFNDPQPYVLEVGCGTGEFLSTLADQHPGTNYLGIDVSRRALYYAVDQASQAELPNLRFLRADVKLLLPLFRAETVSHLYLLYPDPNYGKTHLKHRVLTPSFLDAMHLALVAAGRFTLVTDQEEFFMDMLGLIEADGLFSKNHPERYLMDFDPPIETRFQRAWLRRERAVYRLELVKNPKG